MRWLAPTAVATICVLMATSALAATAPAPLPISRTIGDPSVARTSTGYVLTATGPSVPRAVSTDGVHWTWTTPALTTLPRWANPRGGDIWAADIVKVNTYWVLYFAAPVSGMTSTSRCIGVALARSPTDPFVPYGTQPLSCPTQATAPPGGTRPVAPDQMIDAVGQTTTPTTMIGAIDPGFFHDPLTGRNWLFYKQDGVPSAIRLLPLRGDGLRAGGHSQPIITSPGVIENPSVIQVGSTDFLFASTGSWAHCSYKTVWFSTRNISAWTGPSHDWMTSASTGLCGPGGLDAMRTGSSVSVYLEGWTCRWTPNPCPSNFSETVAGFHGNRSLYGARIVFENSQPVIAHWLPY